MLTVVLVRTRNPLNIGACARALSNFGISDLRLVQPHEPSFREAQSAVGAADVLASARVYSSLCEALSDCTLVVGTTAASHRPSSHPEPLDGAAPGLREQISRQHVALLFGSEKTGLSNEDLSYCHQLVRIPTRPNRGSMNLGQAVAICLYELTRSSAGSPVTASNPCATNEELQRLHAVLLDTLKIAGYIHLNTENHAAMSVRELLNRLSITSADAATLTGMLRKIRLALPSQ